MMDGVIDPDEKVPNMDTQTGGSCNSEKRAQVGESTKSGEDPGPSNEKISEKLKRTPSERRRLSTVEKPLFPPPKLAVANTDDLHKGALAVEFNNNSNDISKKLQKLKLAHDKGPKTPLSPPLYTPSMRKSPKAALFQEPGNFGTSNKKIALDDESTQKVVAELLKAMKAANLVGQAGDCAKLDPKAHELHHHTRHHSIVPLHSPMGGSTAALFGDDDSIQELQSIKKQKSVSYATRETIRTKAHLQKMKQLEEKEKEKEQAKKNRSTFASLKSRISRVVSKPTSESSGSASVAPFGVPFGHNPSPGSVLNELDHITKLQQTKALQKHNKYLDHNPTQRDVDKAKEGRAIELKEKYPQLWESFCSYDLDSSGEIDASELATYLEVELGFEVSDADINRFFEQVDVNNDGGVSFLEIAEWYNQVVTSLDINQTNAKKVTVGNIFDFARFQVGGDTLHAITGQKKRPSIVNQYEIQQTPGEVSKYVIHPHSGFHAIWDLSVSLFLVLTVITLPLTMAFEDINSSLFGINLAVDCIFLMDIVKNFFTGYICIDGFVQLNQSKIVRLYLMSWFFPDLISSVPIDLILNSLDSVESDPLARSAKSFRMLRLVRMTKLFRLLRMGRAAKYLTFWRRFLEDRLKIRIHESTISMSKLGLLLVVIAHWIGCLQFMICRLMDFPESSWVARSAVNEMPVHQQYSWSFFKALAQIVGIGFETPPITNLGCESIVDDEWCTIEMWVTLANMYVGSLFYAITISNISSIIFSMNYATRLYNEKSQQLNEYMRSKHLPPSLRDKVRDYYALRYSEGKIFNEDQIMKDLSPALRKEISIFTSREIFLKVPFFCNSGAGFLSSLAMNLSPMVAFEDDIILEEGTTGDNMFFISSGRVQIYVEEFVAEHEHRKKSDASEEWLAQNAVTKTTQIASIGEGCFFGEVSLLLPVRRTASAKCKTITILYVLEKEALLSSLKDFPEIYARLREICSSRVKRISRKLKPADEKKKVLTLDRDLQDLQASRAAKMPKLYGSF